MFATFPFLLLLITSTYRGRAAFSSSEKGLTSPNRIVNKSKDRFTSLIYKSLNSAVTLAEDKVHSHLSVPKQYKTVEIDYERVAYYYL